jgi:hypothetical protein
MKSLKPEPSKPFSAAMAAETGMIGEFSPNAVLLSYAFSFVICAYNLSG